MMTDFFDRIKVHSGLHFQGATLGIREAITAYLKAEDDIADAMVRRDAALDEWQKQFNEMTKAQS